MYYVIVCECTYEGYKEKLIKERDRNGGNAMSKTLGTIQVDNDVIARIAGSVVINTCGIVGMAMKNLKSGLWETLKKENLTKGVRVTTTADNKVMLTFNVIVAYGTNISTVTNNLISSVKYQVEKYTGMEVSRIKVVVEGVHVND